MKSTAAKESKKKRKRYRLLHKLEAGLETPMFLLAIVWLVFLVLESTRGLTPNQEVVVTLIWVLFIFEFLLKLYLAPRKEKRILTEHLAVANTVIFLSVLLACVGLFILVGGLMFVIEIYIFPEGLMKTWPTLLDLPEIHWTDKLRLAAFISTVGVPTGALKVAQSCTTLPCFAGSPKNNFLYESFHHE